jgi:Ca2+-binding EF-hand superfamily protein
MSRLFSWAVLLLAVAASCVLAAELQFSVSAEQQSYLNALHAPEHAEKLSELKSLFRSLDTNADGVINEAEMASLEEQGDITRAEHMMMQAFDADGSGELSEEEFVMA